MYLSEKAAQIDAGAIDGTFALPPEKGDDGRAKSEGRGKRRARVRMTLTAPGCGMGDILVDDARTKILSLPAIAEADVELVFDPPWSQSMMSDAARLATGMI